MTASVDKRSPRRSTKLRSTGSPVQCRIAVVVSVPPEPTAICGALPTCVDETSGRSLVERRPPLFFCLLLDLHFSDRVADEARRHIEREGRPLHIDLFL